MGGLGFSLNHTLTYHLVVRGETPTYFTSPKSCTSRPVVQSSCMKYVLTVYLEPQHFSHLKQRCSQLPETGIGFNIQQQSTGILYILLI